MLRLENQNFEDEVLKMVQDRIISGYLDALILFRLRKARLSGYDLVKLIHADFNLLVSPGTVYSTLYSLERKGYIVCLLNGRKRTCTLTEKGETLLKIITESQKLRILLKQINKPFFFMINEEHKFLKASG
jgi:DNA-binding PadR family transcriptional regulator